MKHTNCTFTALCAAPLLLSACAGSSEQYPSLAVRDAERASGQFTPVSPTPAAPSSSGDPRPAEQTFDQLRGFVEQARAAHQRFVADEGAARSLAAASRGTDPTSDVRSRALVAVANLSSLHSQTNIALSDLDQLEFSSASTFAPTQEIRAAQVLIGRMITQQDAALDSLTAQLSP